MQFVSQRRPVEQAAEGGGPKLVGKITEVSLESPCRQDDIQLPGRTTLLLSGTPPPFGALLPPVYETPEGNKEPEAKSEQQNLWSVPECSATRQVLDCNTRFDFWENVGDDGEDMEFCDLDMVMGEDRVGNDDDSKQLFGLDEEIGEAGDKVGYNSDSSELCGFDEDLVLYVDLGRGEYGDSLDGSDSEIEEHGDSLDGSDSEMGEYDDSGILSDVEDTDSGYFDESKEDESYYEDTQDAEGSEQIDGAHEQTREDDGPEGTHIAAGYVANENFLGYSTPEDKLEAMQIVGRPREKLPLPIPASLIKRNYASYGDLQIGRGIVRDWACVNFSNMYARLHHFFNRLGIVCNGIGMVVTSVEEFSDYRAVVQPNNEVIIKHLFTEHGGMIG